MMSHVIILILAILKHETSGNISNAKEVLNIPKKGLCVYCMECCLQQIDGGKSKTIFFYGKMAYWWINLARHVKKRHPIESPQATSNPAGFHIPKLSALGPKTGAGNSQRNWSMTSAFGIKNLFSCR